MKSEYMINAVRSAIAHLDRGTVGISRNCLWQLTVRHIKNGPVGTNCAYVARQDFDAVVSAPPFNRFVYAD